MSPSPKRPRSRPAPKTKPARRRTSSSRAAGASFDDFVADQLAGLGEVELRAMFGGRGIYLDGRFFGIVHKSRLFFRVGPSTIELYRARGMKEFNPYGKPLTTYYEVPPEVQEEGPELKRWALASVGTVARSALRGRPR